MKGRGRSLCGGQSCRERALGHADGAFRKSLQTQRWPSEHTVSVENTGKCTPSPLLLRKHLPVAEELNHISQQKMGNVAD